MSEYQYYEFQAIDRSLTPEQQDQIRKLSSRVRPTATQAVFTYSYGDFRGDPLTVLEQHFDAMLYMANWGSKQLAFRFPRPAVVMKRLEGYSIEVESDYANGVSLRSSAEHIILSIEYHDDEPPDWIEGEGVLGSLIPIREDILRGDFRALYLAWLKAAAMMAEPGDEPWDEEEDSGSDGEEAELIEPTVPPGLGHLTGPLQALVEFFDIDQDLVRAAASASPRMERTHEPVEAWIKLLPEAERDAFLVRVAHGETHVGVELMRRLREVAGSHSQAEGRLPARRSFAAIVAVAESIRLRRKAQERQAAEQVRIRRLEALAQREPEAWQQVMTLIEQKQAKAYDEAVKLLVELRDLAEHRGEIVQFEARMSAIQERYARSRTLLERLRKARLL